MLQAAALTQTETGAPVIIHPGRSSEAPAEIIRILQEAGGDITKTVMSHLDSKYLYFHAYTTRTYRCTRAG